MGFSLIVSPVGSQGSASGCSLGTMWCGAMWYGAMMWCNDAVQCSVVLCDAVVGAMRCSAVGVCQDHSPLWQHHWQRSVLLFALVPTVPVLYRLETVNGAMFLRKMELETKLQLLKVINWLILFRTQRSAVDSLLVGQVGVPGAGCPGWGQAQGCPLPPAPPAVLPVIFSV